MRKKYILKNRFSDVLFGGDEMEHLHTFKKFPVFIGCTKKDESEDLFEDMSFDISKNTGVIQLRKTLPLAKIYSEYHSEAIGKTWENHHIILSELINKYAKTKVLEIGGSNGNLASMTMSKNNKIKWTILEPNPSVKNKKIKVIKDSLDENTNLKIKYDTIVHSHVLEHFHDIQLCLNKIYDFLEKDGTHVFSVPNLHQWLINKLPNTLNFEHTVFLTEYFIDILLKKAGFITLYKKNYYEHSIFYVVKKRKKYFKNPILIENHYNNYKKIFKEYLENNESFVKNANKKIDDFKGPIFLFGAHIFSQSLLNLGLNKNRIKYILDNSKKKQGLRLYGTNLIVKSPEILKRERAGLVILRTGSYTEEIKIQIEKINPKIKIIL